MMSRSEKMKMLDRELKAALDELNLNRNSQRYIGMMEPSKANPDTDVEPKTEIQLPVAIQKYVLKKGKGDDPDILFDNDPSNIARYKRFMKIFATHAVIPTDYSALEEVLSSSKAKTSDIWVDGIVLNGPRADLDIRRVDNMIKWIGMFQKKDLNIHLLGTGKTCKYVHPVWFLNNADSFSAQNGYVYAPDQKRPDITLHIDNTGSISLYGMKFTPSNFIKYTHPVNLSTDLGVDFSRYDDVGRSLSRVQINTTEKLIQLTKNLASTLQKYAQKDVAGYTDDQVIDKNKKTLELAIDEMEPDQQKLYGRSALVNIKEYFSMANGKEDNVHDPSWKDVGTNVLIQAFGAMLRFYTGDMILEQFLQMCIRHDITIIEAAIHGEVKSGGEKISYGADPDITWGGSLVYPWMSPACHRFQKGRNHLGLGYKLIMHAMEEKNETKNRTARKVLGIGNDQLSQPLLEGDFKKKCKEVCENLFAKIFGDT